MVCTVSVVVVSMEVGRGEQRFVFVSWEFVPLGETEHVKVLCGTGEEVWYQRAPVNEEQKCY